MSIRATALIAVLAVGSLGITTAPADAGSKPTRAGIARAHAATVRLEFGGSLCSGTIIGSHAILTATHCLQDDPRTVHVSGKFAEVVDRIDDGNDHSILWVAAPLPHARAVIATQAPESGDEVRLYGNPGGLRDVLRRGLVVGFRTDAERPYILLDLNCFPGDSGGAIFNERGEVVTILLGLYNLQEGGSYAKFSVAAPLVFEAGTLARASR